MIRQVITTLGEARPSNYSGGALKESNAVAALAHELIGVEAVEVFVVFALDQKHRLLGWYECSRGTLTSTLVHPREVYAPALRMNAAACIVSHNHPSGVSDPSVEDLDVTRRLRECGNLLGIPLLDHVIVTADSSVHHSIRASTPWVDLPKEHWSGSAIVQTVSEDGAHHLCRECGGVFTLAGLGQHHATAGNICRACLWEIQEGEAAQCAIDQVRQERWEEENRPGGEPLIPYSAFILSDNGTWEQPSFLLHTTVSEHLDELEHQVGAAILRQLGNKGSFYVCGICPDPEWAEDPEADLPIVKVHGEEADLG